MMSHRTSIATVPGKVRTAVKWGELIMNKVDFMRIGRGSQRPLSDDFSPNKGIVSHHS